jgi:hypothetical protein
MTQIADALSIGPYERPTSQGAFNDQWNSEDICFWAVKRRTRQLTPVGVEGLSGTPEQLSESNA